MDEHAMLTVWEAHLVVVEMKDGKIVSERIHWDQASVLGQVGLLDPARLPVAGVETARKVLDPDRPSNTLMKRGGGRGPVITAAGAPPGGPLR